MRIEPLHPFGEKHVTNIVHYIRGSLLPAAIVASFALGLTSCGGSLSAKDAVTQAIQKTCQKAFQCMSSYPSNAGTSFQQQYGTSESDCENRFGALADASAIQASVDAGRIKYSSANAQTCLDAYSSMTCTQFWNGGGTVPAECNMIFSGSVADGGKCTLDEDCANSSSICNASNVCAAH